MPDNYARPEKLVETSWLADHMNDRGVRIVEVDVDTTAYETGHIPGALGWHYKNDLQDPYRRDVINQTDFERLMERAGITNDTMVVVYGDNNNWFAAWAFWILSYYGHENVKIMNGGRKKWVEEGRPLTTDVPTVSATTYRCRGAIPEIRAKRDLVLQSVGKGNIALVDVRSPREFSGELLAPENLPQEGAQRGGHIPGAANIPWAMAVQDDGTFKSGDELRQLYQEKGVSPDKPVIAYCRIGERSSHTWFVLKYLLGYNDVRNYDGSWTEYGSLVDAPIER